MLDTEDYGKDLATVQNLVKKHQLLDADVKAHDDRVQDLNHQADQFIESGVLDTETIREKKESINERYERFVHTKYDISGLLSSVRRALVSKLRGPGFKSRPGTVGGPVTIMMWGARLG